MTTATSQKMMTFDAGAGRILHVGDEVNFLDTPFAIDQIVDGGLELKGKLGNQQIISLNSVEVMMNDGVLVVTKAAPSRDISIDRVKSVYSGKAGKCCCGCAGKHFYASKHVAAASKSRGYEVTPDEVSDRMIKKVVGIINGILNGTNPIGEVDITDNDFQSVIVGERLYIAYFVD